MILKTARFKHMLFYSKDGNFHQCQHSKKMDPNDVPLTKGASYFAHEDEYADHLKSAKGTMSDKEVGIRKHIMSVNSTKEI